MKGFVYSLLLLYVRAAASVRVLINARNETKVAHDYSSNSCDHLYIYADNHNRHKQCAFARTCNDGDGIFAPIVYCSERFSTNTLAWFLTPALVIFLIVLFRMVASTAEDFFCPALEMLSVKMGLPTRFAGVTLLALGNGAPDIASTVNAIRMDRKVGYLMALGELTGAGMFIGTMVTGAVVVIAGSIPCVASLVRDVVMFFITLAVVYYFFAVRGEIGLHEIAVFLWMYFAYVMLVLLSDMYHRHVIIPKQKQHHRHKAQQQDLEASREPVEKTPLLQSAESMGANSIEKVIEAVSYYNDIDSSHHSGWSSESENAEEKLVVVHLQHGGVKKVPYHGMDQRNDQNGPPTLESSDSTHYSISCSAMLSESASELAKYLKEEWGDIYNNDENSVLVKILLTLELPFTILRQLSVPIPCDGYYCRPVVALSTALSPFWLKVYLHLENDIDLFTVGGPAVGALVVCVPFVIGLLILRFAPSGKGPMSAWVSTPLAIYGFFIAATWIDLIADKLVDVLSFLGIIFHIPGPIMGLSVLAVGNSIGDLAANVAVARKGLANMAITACFAGPVFNYLIGLGIGFGALRAMTGMSRIPVDLPPSLQTGFIFSMVNCVLVVVVGLCFGRGTLTKEYGYAALALYVAYALTSLLI